MLLIAGFCADQNAHRRAGDVRYSVFLLAGAETMPRYKGVGLLNYFLCEKLELPAALGDGSLRGEDAAMRAEALRLYSSYSRVLLESKDAHFQ